MPIKRTKPVDGTGALPVEHPSSTTTPGTTAPKVPSSPAPSTSAMMMAITGIKSTVSGLWRPRPAPSAIPTVGQVPAGTWVNNMGVVRMYGVRKEHGSDITNYEAHFIFPNLTELSFTVAVNSKGYMEVVDDPKSPAQFTDANGYKHTGIAVSKKSASNGIFEVDLSLALGLELPLFEINLATSTVARGDMSGTRLLLQNMKYEGDTTPFVVFKKHPPNPKVVHLDKLSNSSPAAGKSGSHSLYGLWLSNGDYIEFTVWSSHHGTGEYEVLNARLSPFYDDDPKSWFLLEVKGSGSGGKGKFISINGQDYDIEIRAKIPQGSIGDMSIDPENVKIKKSPTIQLEDLPNLDPSSSKPSWLIPDIDTTRLLNHAPWDERLVELKFHGEIEGKIIPEGIGIKVHGRFIGGEFVPEFTSPQEILVFSDKGERIDIELSRDGTGFQIAVVKNPTTKLLLSRQQIGQTPVFSDEQVDLVKLAEKIYTFNPLTPHDILQDDWSTVSDELYLELKRFLVDTLKVQRDDISTLANNKNIIRILFNGQKSLYLQRSETDNEIHFKLLATQIPHSLTGFLSLGEDIDTSLETLLFGEKEGLQIPRPWQGMMEMVDEITFTKIFTDGEYPFLHLDWNTPKSELVFRLPKLGENSEIRGRLDTSYENGHQVLQFSLENGHTLKIHLPDGSHEKLFDTLVTLESPPQDTIPELHVEAFDGHNQLIQSGTLINQHSRWAIDWTGDKKQDFALVTKNRHVVITVGELIEKFIFPWEEGDYALPSLGTRTQMERIYSLNQTPKDGEVRQFEFYGDPVGGTSVAEIAPVMRRDGDKATKFFGWIINLKVVFDKKLKQWRPLPEGFVEMQRRTPWINTGSPEVVGHTFEKNRCPYTLVPTSTGWGLKLADGKILQAYRASVSDTNFHKFLPDFALSFGEPSAQALSALRGPEAKTRAIAVDASKIPTIPMTVEAITDDGKTVLIHPIFGEPIFKAHTPPVNGNVTLLDFAPGYSDFSPDWRFSKLTLQDGNGLKFEVVFQHIKDQVHVVGARAMGDNVLSDLFIGQKSNLSYLQGLIPARYRFSGTAGFRAGTLPVEINWTMKGSDFFVEALTLGDAPFTIENLHFDPQNWKIVDITRPQTNENWVPLTPSISRTPSGGRKAGPILPPSTNVFLLPDIMDLLTQGKDATGNPLPAMVSAKFLNIDPNLNLNTVEIPLVYNEKLQTYEPYTTSGFLFAKMDGVAVSLVCSPTYTERNWAIHLPGGAKAYLGNFFVTASEKGRPLPVMWFSGARDPHRSTVNKFLEDSNLATGIANYTAFDPATKPDFELTVRADGQDYVIPLRAKVKSDGRFMVVPRSCAFKKIGNQREPRALNYYQELRGSPAVIEVDGFGFEIEIMQRSHAPTPIVSLRQTHPGASAVYTDARAKMNVLLEQNNQSSLLLLDVDDSDFLAAIGERMLSSDSQTSIPSVDRILWDALSDRVYEMVSSISLYSSGQTQLTPIGFAMIHDNTVTLAGDEYLLHRGRVYIHTLDGYYISFSSYPSHTLQVTSHGRTLGAEFLSKTWIPLSADESLFSKRVPTAVIPKKLVNPYAIMSNRDDAYKELAKTVGIERDNIWDLANDFAKGMEIPQQPYDPSTPHKRVFLRKGGLRIEVDFNGPVPLEGTLKVTFGNHKIPAVIWEKWNRYYLVLGGAMKGVVFYFQKPEIKSAVPKSVNLGTYKLTELTHKDLRETLQKDLGVDILPYIPVKNHQPNCDPSIIRQVARTRLWKLEQSAVLPTELVKQDFLSPLLIPDPTRPPRLSRPPRLNTLEEIAATESLKIFIQRGLDRISVGTADWLKQLDDVVTSWDHFHKVRDFLSQTKANEALINALAHFADIPTATAASTAAVAGKLVSNRDQMRGKPVTNDIIQSWVRDIYGKDVSDLVSHTTLNTLDELSRAMVEAIGGTWEGIKAKIHSWETANGLLTPLEEIGVILETTGVELGVLSSSTQGAKRLGIFERKIVEHIPEAARFVPTDADVAQKTRTQLMDHLFATEPASGTIPSEPLKTLSIQTDSQSDKIETDTDSILSPADEILAVSDESLKTNPSSDDIIRSGLMDAQMPVFDFPGSVLTTNPFAGVRAFVQ